jgi:hypothetical protein
MSVNQPMNKEMNESGFGWQVYLLWFIALIAVALLILPLLPGLVANFVYSFSGEAPKIYWYLSRASGIVSFSILWVSMALGLGITNKMARLWPGAPAAFAIHQHTSLLGLAFAVYHALVLMGDHFVDFSLPRLILPFSIAYETFWVGLGQICFYIWLLVVMSFYVRQRIGQKTWRMIHYVNFVIFVMAFLHGVKSGTDSNTPWISWYFWVSGVSLVILLAHRIYELSLKKRISSPGLTTAYIQEIALEMKEILLEIKDTTAKMLTGRLLITRFKNPSLLLLWSQLKQSGKIPGRRGIPVSVSDPTKSEPWAPLLSDGSFEEQANKKDIPVAVSEIPASEIRKIIDGSVVTLEGTYQGNPIRVRIFGEPSQKTDPELNEITESEHVKLSD